MTKRHAAILLAILNNVSVPGPYVEDVATIKVKLRLQFEPGEIKANGHRPIDEWLPMEGA